MVLVVFPEVELLDLAAPLQVFALAGRRWNFRPFKLHVSAPNAGLVSTRSQLRIEAPIALSNAPAAEVLLIPGGYGARALKDDPATLADLARIGGAAEIVAAVGWGVALLARSGLADDARVATSPEVAELLREAAPKVRVEPDFPILSDGRTLTARTSGEALDLGLAIVERLFGAKLATLTRADLGLCHDRIELAY